MAFSHYVDPSPAARTSVIHESKGENCDVSLVSVCGTHVWVCVVSGPSGWCAHSGRLSSRTHSRLRGTVSAVIVVVLTTVNLI